MHAVLIWTLESQRVALLGAAIDGRRCNPLFEPNTPEFPSCRRPWRPWGVSSPQAGRRAAFQLDNSLFVFGKGEAVMMGRRAARERAPRKAQIPQSVRRGWTESARHATGRRPSLLAGRRMGQSNGANPPPGRVR